MGIGSGIEIKLWRRLCFIFLIHLSLSHSYGQSALPVPDHIVIVILENHSYTQIIGSSAAPYMNSLANDPYTALFTASFGIQHPSQPNYLDFYSGCNQGVTTDLVPSNNPFVTPNLGRQLIDSGYTFITYSESLPSIGFNGSSSGDYARKHNPAANWMGADVNQIPVTTNQPFSAFPSDYSLLPTVCFVIPNQSNDMHNGSDPARITTADTWVYNHLEGYIKWAQSNNSLLILTFDEDDGSHGNRITTLFNGQMVKAGQYAETINHYRVLRTIEDIYTLPYACNAATMDPIIDCWNLVSAIDETTSTENHFIISPNPAHSTFSLICDNPDFTQQLSYAIYDVTGKLVFDGNFKNSAESIKPTGILPGFYVVVINDGNQTSINKLVIE